MTSLQLTQGIIGRRVEHLGSPGSFGTVVDSRFQMYATDPIHEVLTIVWESGPLSRSMAGISSVRVVA